ncbi:MAG: ATP-binding cassette domain-containing protein [Spirochaetales bacterium]|nr:ATP-binding cassette domain-containing protein [Spirochaetales bacterium]
MISTSNVTLSYGTQILFKDVSIKFRPGNCYGLIGANGAGKSTFLKILSGEIEADSGEVIIDKNQRLAVLKQDQFAYDEYSVLHTVILGYEKLYALMQERDALYAKEDFSEEDGLKAAELEGEFSELNGWEAESEAGILLSGLGIPETLHEKKMKDLEQGQKVKVLLAQALFGNPDILLLDEPTNGLDIESITWLEEFLYKYTNTVIVVSHDRHFLNRICTHIADIDFKQIKLYVGNYDFWYQASQLMGKQRQDEQKKSDDKIKDLKAFIERFSSNASKARQATARKKMLDKLTLEDLPPTSRRFPWVHFKPDRDVGDIILEVHGISKTVEQESLFSNLNLVVVPKDKIAFVGKNHIAKSALFDIVMDLDKPDKGSYKWGVTITPSYFPKNNAHFFETDYTLVDWLRQFSKDEDENYVRGFLGRMLFSGDEALKKANVLSGGEKVRCMLSRMMLSGANVLIFDEPTNHLDLEAITALNNALIDFPGVILFSSHDHQFVDSIANRIIEFTPKGIIDRRMSFDEYITDERVQALRDEHFGIHQRMNL